MCPCRVFFGAGWHLDGRQMFQIKAVCKNTLAQKIEKYESFIHNDYFLQIVSEPFFYWIANSWKFCLRHYFDDDGDLSKSG